MVHSTSYSIVFVRSNHKTRDHSTQTSIKNHWTAITFENPSLKSASHYFESIASSHGAFRIAFNLITHTAYSLYWPHMQYRIICVNIIRACMKKYYSHKNTLSDGKRTNAAHHTKIMLMSLSDQQHNMFVCVCVVRVP